MSGGVSMLEQHPVRGIGIRQHLWIEGIERRGLNAVQPATGHPPDLAPDRRARLQDAEPGDLRTQAECYAGTGRAGHGESRPS